jgi:hypothetical protein
VPSFTKRATASSEQWIRPDLRVLCARRLEFPGDGETILRLADPQRAVPADVHGILLRVAALEDTLRGKMKAWSDAEGRQSKRLKDLATSRD